LGGVRVCSTQPEKKGRRRRPGPIVGGKRPPKKNGIAKPAISPHNKKKGVGKNVFVLGKNPPEPSHVPTIQGQKKKINPGGCDRKQRQNNAERGSTHRDNYVSGPLALGRKDKRGHITGPGKARNPCKHGVRWEGGTGREGENGRVGTYPHLTNMSGLKKKKKSLIRMKNQGEGTGKRWSLL